MSAHLADHMLVPLWRYSINYLKNRTIVDTSDAAAIDRRRKYGACVIDDQHFYPLDNLREQGFDNVYIGNPNTPQAVKRYEIVVCDLKKVAMDFDSHLQGGGLIRAIRHMFPEKYIIAYSGSFVKSDRVTVAEAHSNSRVSKAASPSEWAMELDLAIGWLSDPIKRWNQVKADLERRTISPALIRRAEDAYVRSIVSANNTAISELSNSASLPQDLRAVLQGLASSALWTILTGR